MPNSDYNLTRDALVRRALRKLGNTNPANEDIQNAVQSLNLILKRVDVQGKWAWAITQTESSLTLSANTQTYSTGTVATTIPADILALETFDLYSGNTHTPCTILTKREALQTSYRDGTGQPVAVYLERKPLLANNKLWVYPSPSGSFTAKFTYRRRLYDFDASTDNPDFPSEWLDCLTYQLASDLVEDYGTPDPAASRIIGRAGELMSLMKAANQEEQPTHSVKTEYF